jgi:hypothetical protein
VPHSFTGSNRAKAQGAVIRYLAAAQRATRCSRLPVTISHRDFAGT